MDHTIILASQSIGRRKLLEKLGIPFETLPADIDEDSIIHTDPRETIRLRARAKAEHTRNNLLKSPTSPNTLIIAADSMVILNGTLYGKPKDQKDAIKILQILRGKTHVAATHTVCLISSQDSVLRSWEQMTETKLTMNDISDAELRLYIKTYDVLRFAGCYSFDEAPWNLFSKIDGSYTNVIGLPLEVILPILRTLHLL